MNNERCKQLAISYIEAYASITGTVSQEEIQEVIAWVQADPANKPYGAILREAMKAVDAVIKVESMLLHEAKAVEKEAGHV